MKIYSKRIAMNIAKDFQFLIGRPFTEPFTTCNIDAVEAEQLLDGTYLVALKHDSIIACSVAQLFGFPKLKEDLFDYLETKGIEYE